MIGLISRLELCSSSCQCVAIFIAALYMNTAKTNEYKQPIFSCRFTTHATQVTQIKILFVLIQLWSVAIASYNTSSRGWWIGEPGVDPALEGGG